MTGRLSGWIISIVLLATLSLSLNGTTDTPEPDKSAASPVRMPARKTVTWPTDTMRVSKALTELAKQTGIRVEDVRGGPDEAIQLDLKQTSFWQALDALAAAANARVNLYPTSGRIALAKRGTDYRLPPISYDGRFRLSVKKVTASRDLEIRDKNGLGGATNLAVEVAWDPELLPLYLETRPRGLRLVDDKNNVLSIPDEGSSLAPVEVGRIALGVDVRLPALPRSVSAIHSLEGELSMIGPSKMLTFTFAMLDRLAETKATDPERQLTQEDVTCRILDVKLLRDRWSLRVELLYPRGMKQLDTYQSWVVNNEMTLESPDGKKRLPNTGYALVSATSQRAVLVYHFRDHGASKRGKPGNWRVRYRTPANLIEAPIKFTFKDIPLP